MILPVHRIVTTWLAFAATVALTAGCAGGKVSTAASITKAHAAAYARAVNLRAGDAPGMSPASGEGETTVGALAVKLPGCGGGLPGWEAGSLRSPRFETALGSPFEAVWSAVHIVTSPAVAVRDLAADRTPHVRACIARAFGAAYAQRGPLVHESISVSALPSELPGMEGGFRLRVTHRVIYREANHRPPEHNQAEKLAQIRGKRGTLSWDVVGFASGRVEIALTDFHEPRVAPARTERRLLALLYSRAKAHNL